MSDEGIVCVSSRFNDRCTNRLLAQEFIPYAMLDASHKLGAMNTNDRSINSGIHDSKRIGCRNETIMWFKVFESRLKYPYIRQPIEAIPKCIAHFGIRMDKPEIDRERHKACTPPHYFYRILKAKVKSELSVGQDDNGYRPTESSRIYRLTKIYLEMRRTR